jgi:hypothetical protein
MFLDGHCFPDTEDTTAKQDAQGKQTCRALNQSVGFVLHAVILE